MMSKYRYLVLYYNPEEKEKDSYSSGIMIEAESHFQAERLWMDAIGFQYNEDDHRFGKWRDRLTSSTDTMQWMIVHESEWRD